MQFRWSSFVMPNAILTTWLSYPLPYGAERSSRASLLLLSWDRIHVKPPSASPSPVSTDFKRDQPSPVCAVQCRPGNRVPVSLPCRNVPLFWGRRHIQGALEFRFVLVKLQFRTVFLSSWLDCFFQFNIKHRRVDSATNSESCGSSPNPAG